MGHVSMSETENGITMEFAVVSNDFTLAGEASGIIKRTLQQLGVDSKVVRRVAIAAYEAEMNIVIHSFGGKIVLTVDPTKIKIVAKDQGPGIADIELAMQEGYSTAPQRVREMGFGAGMGLPNIKKCSDGLSIKSEQGIGTEVEMEFYY